MMTDVSKGKTGWSVGKQQVVMLAASTWLAPPACGWVLHSTPS